MSEGAAHILVVDDDQRLRDLLGRFLTESGFIVMTASDAADARRKLSSVTVDLIILDLMMPGESGLDFAEALQPSGVPILMLTAMGEAKDRIAGLERGADDYLVKPFEPRELVLRVNNILKRAPQLESAPREVRMGDKVFDLGRSELLANGEPVRLTDAEAALLGALASRPGVSVTREMLIAMTGAAANDRAVDVQVMRLRRKIERDPSDPRYLQTVRGKGYVLVPD
jgi:two-component system phosphate regulon response regulator OmpR